MLINYFYQLSQFAYTHTIVFVFIVVASLLAIFILTVLLLNPKKQNKTLSPIPIKQTDPKPNTQDIQAIAGDDIIMTQLDLARAYIELGKQQLAKQILADVTTHGNHDQQQIAQQLLSTL